jgi:outer membrane lipopolysaccharide assembly protein LptE/RlpB
MSEHREIKRSRDREIGLADKPFLDTRSLYLLISLSILIVCSGCGYHFAGRGSTLPPHIKTIAIPHFENKTYEPRLEDFITNLVVNEFHSDGRLKVAQKAEADALLTGRIISYEAVPLSIDRFQRVQEYRIRIRFDMKLEDLREKKVIWKETGMETRPIRAEYRSTENVEETKQNKDLALQSVGKDFAEELVSRVFEAF